MDTVTNVQELSLKKQYPLKTYLKFIIFSAFGIFAFFIDFSVPKFTLNLFGYSFSYGPSTTFLVNHCVGIIKVALLPIMRYVVFICGVAGVVDLFVRRKKHFGTALNAAFSIFKIIGLILLTFIVFNFGPGLILQDKVGPFLLNNILISITITIPVSAAFLPFLLDYGLVELVGVIVRPVMRPLFKLPGRAAVIMVSAFLGNFSVGHIAVNDQYKQGRMNTKEAVIIGTSFSTVSVGFMMVLANNTGIISEWNKYFWSAFLITLLVSFIGIRLYPLRRQPEDYYPGATPNPEPVFRTNLLKNALSTALETADNSDAPHKRIAYILKESLTIISIIPTGTAFFGCLGILLNMYTPLFTLIGYIFYPFLMLVGIPVAEVGIASTGAALSLLEVTLPSLLVAGGEFSIAVRYMLAVLPVSSIIFLASFVPCLMGTELPVKFPHLVVIWLERMILSIILVGLFALILF